MPEHFYEFVQTSSYKNLVHQVKSDIEIISIQCMSYSSDISNCNQEIQREFNINSVASSNFDRLVNETVDQYWFLLTEALHDTSNNKRRDLIRVLQALSYYKANKEIKSEEFDSMMTVLDFEVAEKEIVRQYQKAFE